MNEEELELFLEDVCNKCTLAKDDPLSMLCLDGEEYKDFLRLHEYILNTCNAILESVKKDDDSISFRIAINYLSRYLDSLTSKFQEICNDIDERFTNGNINELVAITMNIALAFFTDKKDKVPLINFDYESLMNTTNSSLPYVVVDIKEEDKIKITMKPFENKIKAFQYCLENGISRDYIVNRYI